MSFLYNARGDAVGFLNGHYIHTLNGTPVGRVNDERHVHKLTGEYVGELYLDMVVDMGLQLGSIGNPGNPGNPGGRGNPGNRGAVPCHFPEVFDALLS